MAPDFTNAFLVSFFWLVFMGLLVVWAQWGFVPAVILGLAADRALVYEWRRRYARR